MLGISETLTKYKKHNKTMLCDHQLEDIWKKARDVARDFPVTYQNLFGHERLAVLPVLTEPIQSTLHAVLQQNVPTGTKCIMEGCAGTLDTRGGCTEKCTQSGVNVIQDIIDCRNCDSYGFPCPTCHTVIFRKQLKQYLDY